MSLKRIAYEASLLFQLAVSAAFPTALLSGYSRSFLTSFMFFSSALRSASGAVTSNASRSPYPDTPTTRMVIDLYKRVEVLERENYQRYLREMVGYALLIGFVAIKGMSFFLKR